MNESQHLTKQLSFQWGFLRVALEGYSYIDIQKLYVSSKVEARQFLDAYGYDYEDPMAREEIWKLYFEAIAFIKNNLLNPGEDLPPDFLQRASHNDILKLLVDATIEAQKPRGKWCCAILRVMHIISHLDNDIRLEHFGHAREQIFGRLDRYVSVIGPRQWQFGQGVGSVKLVRYLKKYRKERNSIIIKLLSKANNIVENIYDSLGVRFVTESRYESYRLLQELFASGALSPTNVQPGRSVNTLIPLDVFKDTIEEVRQKLNEGELSPTEVRRCLDKLEDETLVSLKQIQNPFSSRWYRAIQFTGRQLITVQDPTYRFWMEMRAQIAKSPALESELSKIPVTIREKKSFYYPFEVQIMDKASYVESIGGRSRHREYKAKQRLMARNRVLRDLV